MAVKPTRRGCRISDGDDGVTVLEVWHVDGLSGAAASIQYAALNASGVPQKGEGHPYVPDVFVRSRDAENIAPDTVRLTITWTPRNGISGQPDETDPGVLTISSALVTTTTEVDRDGNAITVSYTPTTGERAGITDPQGGSVELQVPQLVARLERRERFAPTTKAATYTGRVNAGNWNGYPPRTWLAMPIEGTTSDGGLSYQVRYEFIHRPETWDARVAYIDPVTGKRPPDLVADVGIKSVRVYPEADFGPLGITLP